MTQTTHEQYRILRRKEVQERTGLAQSTLYTRVSEGKFPPPIHLGGTRTVGWVEAEVNDWVKKQIELSRGALPNTDSQ